MQGLFSYPMPQSSATSPPGQHLDPATGNSSPMTTPTHSINYPSTAVVFPVSGYHYKKKNANGPATTPSMHSTEPGRNPKPKVDTMHGIATIGKTHRSSFSLSSFIGGAPMDAQRCDPSPRSSSGVSAQYGDGLNQGPSQEHPETGTQKKLEALEPANTLQRLRKSPSAVSLKLKIPRLKSTKQRKHKDSDASSASQITNLPLSSSSTLRLGRMGKRNGSIDSTSPGSKEGFPSATNSPSRSATSMALRNEEEPSPAPPRPATAPNLAYSQGQNIEDRSALPPDTVSSAIDGSEYRKLRIQRAQPAKTQDDISLNTHSAIDKYKSWKFSRRASLSATKSFSEFCALSTAQINATSLKLDLVSNKNSDDTQFLTGVDPGNSGSKPKGPVPSPPLVLKYSTGDLLTPKAPICPDMTFLPSDDTPVHHSQPPVRESTSTPTSRAPSSASGVSTPGMTSVSSLYTTSSISLHHEKNQPTPVQLAQWREDGEMIMDSLDDEFEGEVCLMRYEPKQGWFGFWNRESVTDVIDDLRELRSPRP